jgi:hypothetical protein
VGTHIGGIHLSTTYVTPEVREEREEVAVVGRWSAGLGGGVAVVVPVRTLESIRDWAVISRAFAAARVSART